MTTAADDLRHLTGPAAGLGAMGAHPRRIAWAAVVAMVVLAWVYIIVLTSAAGLGRTFGALGPGMSVLDRLVAATGLDAAALPAIASHDWLAALIAVCATPPAHWAPADLALHASMWLAMCIAMMLPSAAPMLRTYAEIADTAAAKDEGVLSPLVLALGYLAVWAAFALGATLLQMGLARAGALSVTGTALSGGLAVATLAVAGLYQFTQRKAACLVKCANPFPYLFANWSDTPRGVFGLGLRQGLYCLACCWALMLVMFAVGLMNIVWIALLTVVMTAEKLIGAGWFSRLVGTVLLAWAAAAALGLPVAGWR